MNKHLLPNLQLGNSLGEEGRTREREGEGGRERAGRGEEGRRGREGRGKGGGREGKKEREGRRRRGRRGRGKGGSKNTVPLIFGASKSCKMVGYCPHKHRRLTCNVLMGGGTDTSLHFCSLARIYTFLVNLLPFLPRQYLQREQQKQIKLVLRVRNFLRQICTRMDGVLIKKGNTEASYVPSSHSSPSSWVPRSMDVSTC